MDNIFFKLPRSKAKKVIDEAIRLKKSIIIDELNCDISCRRRPTKKTIEEILKIGFDDSNTQWHFIIRKSHYTIDTTTDIGLTTNNGAITYFLWIDMDRMDAYNLAKRYTLKRI